MRAAKGRSFAFFFVALSLFVSAPAFASIPRSAALDPSAIDRFALADDAIASTEVLPLHDQLARAARVSWPVESLPETRVGASLELQPLFTEPTPLLTRALHRAYADLCATSASGRTLCAGDPVNCRDPRGEASKPGTVGRLLETQQLRDELEAYQKEVEEETSFWNDVKRAVKQTYVQPIAKALGKRQQIEDQFADTGRRIGGLIAPKSNRQSTEDVREVAASEGAMAALPQERASAAQNRGLRPIAQKTGEYGGKATYAGAETAVLAGGAIVVGGVRDEIIAQNDIRHLNAAIAESRGYETALSRGHIGIAEPGKVTAPGVDFITFDPAGEGSVVIWDAKYRASGKFPSSIPAKKIRKWTEEAKGVVASLPEGPLKRQAQAALDAGRIRPEIFKWPQ